MHCPGPWFTSEANPNVVINLFHPSGYGKYGSQSPLVLNGGYPVMTCYNPLQAFQVSKFPEFIRALELVARHEEIMEAMSEIDEQIARIVVQTMNNVGTNDATPRSYKMLNHPKVPPINPTIGKQFIEEMEKYGLEHTAALYKNFWRNHPWKEDRGRWA